MSARLDHFQDLLVVNLPVQKEPKYSQNWPGKENFFVPETCARHLLIGDSKQDLHRIPREILLEAKANPNGELKVLQGAAAYNYLLETTCGMHSKHRGETNVHGQFKEAWEKHSQEPKNSWQNSALSCIPQLFSDAHLLRKLLVDKLQPVSKERVAREMAGIKGGESVLLLAGAFPSLVRQVSSCIGKFGRDKGVKALTVTQVKPSDLHKTLEELCKLQASGRIIGKVSALSPTQLFHRGLHAYDHVFTCHPMQDDEVNRRLIRGWKERDRKDGHLIHIAGALGDSDKSTTQWQQAKLPRVVLPETITAGYHDTLRQYNLLVARIFQACKECTEMRKNHSIPTETTL